ncbi:MAG: ATP-dependent sacrificial sulfur transferase LarE [Planctomycetaceae bacterium]
MADPADVVTSDERDPVVQVSAQRDRLLETLAGYRRVAVALSAGVDSSVVARAAQLALGDGACAVTADSPSLASGELEEAVDIARRIGIRHHILKTSEFNSPDYSQNPSNRCYYCKSELYGQLWSRRSEWNFDVMVNGANLDDRGDHRPGMLAASEFEVRSPLLECGFTKADVRSLAREWGLPVWDKPAAPCLSSRVAYGVTVTEELVRQIDAAEAWLRRDLNIRELRVRVEAGSLARIEVPLADIPRLTDPERRSRLTEQFRSLGFRAVTLDLEGFRSGNLNATLPAGDLVMLTPHIASSAR